MKLSCGLPHGFSCLYSKSVGRNGRIGSEPMPNHFGAEHPCTTYVDVHQGFLGFDPQPNPELSKCARSGFRFCSPEPLLGECFGLFAARDAGNELE